MADAIAEWQGIGTFPWVRFGSVEPLVRDMLRTLRREQVAQRIWQRDGTLWSHSPAEIAEIQERLGWLDLPVSMSTEVPRLRALAATLREEGYGRAVLMGMGGSSLCAEVYGEAFGAHPDGMELTVLDTTDPAHIARVDRSLDLASTLFIVSSKSGTTSETLAQYRYFRQRCADALGAEWPAHFLAITDPGTTLATLAQSEHFRALYLNPHDIGGRLSALSLFGLVPAALLGLDLERILATARAMAEQCRTPLEEGENPAITLGAALGALGSAASPRKDKLTVLASPSVASFGPWVEQLVAESTGKAGKGIVPVVGERLEPREPLGADRFWVCLRLDGDDNAAEDALVERLIDDDEPVMVFRLRQRYDIAAEYFRWEFATAVAGRCLSLNPFDQPDVESAKERARQALERYEQTRSLPEEAPVLRGDSLALYGPSLNASTVPGYLAGFMRLTQPGDYAAIQAYIERNETHAAALEEIAGLMRRSLGIPVTVGFGPRFLHSTGQLHKGGPNKVLVIQITQDDGEDLGIPGTSYTFGVLKRAQALGDLNALREAGRRAVRVHVGADVEAGLHALRQALAEATGKS